uniref:Uncharacterized protein n=1 Tax=Phaeomonas parva TaxID=124430 RepID=A0A6U4FL22_9STRA|mmetsp:Transcript_26333/g.82007  ORF Transcript_26333/g.82007 Transcript_26333/m.82007 type:complete len:338 (+) Transcript_26333:378-1391(+)|eukprot:CAMPEP_0118878186 /NCGR_PEP_ID=MMETSP1163-20130328/18166_1 /TAXON_ID=124430 /ORGANISM="Phaeomonas parva, Strain CCMP2877" /LENGTH=337 /DNA_ID=CAMNT_0006813991 /DNA_START=377 /DNA_END=1390 /DNA_ORIENTATION=-
MGAFMHLDHMTDQELDVILGLVLYSLASVGCAYALVRFVNAARKSQTVKDFVCGSRDDEEADDLIALNYRSVDYELAQVSRFKFYFHSFLLSSYMLEWVLYVCFAVVGSGGRQQRDTYAVHLMGLFAFFLAFCCVVMVWGTSVRVQHDILGRGSDAQTYFTYFKLTVLSLVLIYAVILVTALAFCYSTPDFNDFLDHWSYQVLALYVACTLTFMSFVILGLGFTVHLRMLRVRPLMQREARFWLAIGKLQVTMAVCVTCFGVWTAAIIWLSNNSDTEDKGALGISGITWHIMCRWVPHLVPGMMMLLFMRHVRTSEASASMVPTPRGMPEDQLEVDR